METVKKAETTTTKSVLRFSRETKTILSICSEIIVI